MTTFESLCAQYTLILAELELPSMSADELWHEVIAVRDGESSHYIPAAWAATRSREQIQSAADRVKAFWDAWEEMERQRRSAIRGA